MWQSLTALFSSSWSAFQSSLSNCLLADTLPQGIRKVLLGRMNKRQVRRNSYKWLIFTMERYQNVFFKIFMWHKMLFLDLNTLNLIQSIMNLCLREGIYQSKLSPWGRMPFCGPSCSVGRSSAWRSSAHRSAQVGLHVLCSWFKVCDRLSGLSLKQITCFEIDLWPTLICWGLLFNQPVSFSSFIKEFKYLVSMVTYNAIPKSVTYSWKNIVFSQFSEE